MTKKLPSVPSNGKNSGKDDGGSGDKIINVENWHHHGNDLAEIVKIAELDSDLAHKIVDNSEKEGRRKTISYRLGLVSTSFILITVLVAVAYLVVNQGIFTMIGAVMLILAIALLIRVILTGEWSETSWFGKGVHFLAKALGSKENGSPDKDNSKD